MDVWNDKIFFSGLNGAVSVLEKNLSEQSLKLG